MGETERSLELDWIHLPPGTEPQSLWTCLHDAELQSVRSDTLERSLDLAFEVSYLRTHHHLPDDLLFQFRFTGVTSVRVTTFVHWPGPRPDKEGKSNEEQSYLVRECQSKGREESVNWDRFEANLKQSSLLVYDADLASGVRGSSLRLEGNWDDEYWYTIFIPSHELSVHRSDGAPFSLTELQRLGEDYWNHFAGRR